MSPSRKRGRAVRIDTERFRLTTINRLQATWHTYQWTFDPLVMHPLGFEAGTWTWRAWYRQFRHFNNRNKYCFAIRPKQSDRVIGLESFEISSNRAAFLTVIIGDRNWWSKEVVRETRTAILDFLFQGTDTGRAFGMPTARNIPSVFNYQVLGFTCEGILRQHAYDPAARAMQDQMVFGILRDECFDKRKKEMS